MKTRSSHYPLSTIHYPLILSLTFLAFGLRVWRLATIPAGWRDDELINVLVISQKVLNGRLAVYYPDASGNEALYHALNAIPLFLFGANFLSFRLFSAIWGTLTIPLTYTVSRRFFGKSLGTPLGLIAAAGLAVSFWSLMYSRFGLRQIMTPLLTLLAIYFFWQTFITKRRFVAHYPLSDVSSPTIHYSLLTALFTALGFYTYFASRGLPLIWLAFGGYLLIFHWQIWRERWLNWPIFLGALLLFSLPLILTLRAQPQAEGRVGELAAPLIAARQGDFSLVQDYTLTTLSMFHAHGDNEWLYNIPDRPVFSLPAAALLWLGILLAFFFCVPLRYSLSTINYQLSTPSAFLLIWFLAGISPGFVSVPAASLGHTIMAQPAVYMLLALPLALWWHSSRLRPFALLTAVLLIANIAWRDLPAYFQEWPSRGMTRFLYHADAQNAAFYLNAHPDTLDFGITGTLDGPWAKLALDVDTHTPIRPRWYNPERVVLLEPPLSFSGFPDVPPAYPQAFSPIAGETAGAYQLSRVALPLPNGEPVCFVNGLCALTAVYHPATALIEIAWRVDHPLDLPDMPLISNPPPPGVYAGPRLAVFAQVWDSADQFLAGDDGLWIDPTTLQTGDIFLQQHRPALPADAQDTGPRHAVFGLYDPMTGQRIPTVDGRELVLIRNE